MTIRREREYANDRERKAGIRQKRADLFDLAREVHAGIVSSGRIVSAVRPGRGPRSPAPDAQFDILLRPLLGRLARLGRDYRPTTSLTTDSRLPTPDSVGVECR